MQETQFWSLGQEENLEKGMAIHYTVLAWRILWAEEPGEPSPWGHKSWTSSWGTSNPKRWYYENVALSTVLFSCSVMSDSLWPHGLQHARPPWPFIANSWSLPKLMSIELVMPSNHLILCCPLLFLPSILPSFKVFSNESSGGQSTEVTASTSVLPVNSQNWFPLGWTGWTSLQSKNLLHHHSSKASIIQCSAFFIVQLSHPYMTTGKTIDWLDRHLLAK